MKITRDFIRDPSLVLYLPLYQLDGVKFADRSAYGHLCTVVGASWTPEGRILDAVDDNINCGNGESIKPTTAITVVVLVKPTIVPGDGTGLVVCKGNALLSYGSYGIRIAYSSAFFILGNLYHRVGGVVAGKCYHIVGTWNKTESNIRVYQNAILGTYAFGTRTEDIVYDTNPLLLGSSTGNSHRFAGGLISEVRIYNRSWDALEVREDLQKTKRRLPWFTV